MRIISGQLKSQKLIQPKNSLIRPTSDRSKEMIFSTLNSILENEDRRLEDLRVLDGFCGTGSLGIEALSRGARSSTFVDNCNESLKLTMNNCKKLNLMKKSYFLNYDLTKKIKENKSFGLFFLDPPYKDEIINKSLELLFKKKWIINDSIGIIESSKDQEIEKFEFINMIKKKKMGISSFSFIRVI
mgnify:FL=1